MTTKTKKPSPLITAEQIMTQPVICIHTSDTVRHAASIFLNNNVSGAPVLNHLEEPVGVLTKTDILRYERDYVALRMTETMRQAMKTSGSLELIAAKHGFHEETEEDYVTHWMTPKIYTVSLNASLADVVREMNERRIHRIFIRNHMNSKITGVITTFDLLKFMGRVFFAKSGGTWRPKNKILS